MCLSLAHRRRLAVPVGIKVLRRARSTSARGSRGDSPAHWPLGRGRRAGRQADSGTPAATGTRLPDTRTSATSRLSALRQTVRARCTSAAVRDPHGTTNWLNGASRSEIRSMSASRASTCRRSICCIPCSAARGVANSCAKTKQFVLDPLERAVDFRGKIVRPGKSQDGVQLVDGADRLDADHVLADSRPPDKPRLSLVACSRVNLRRHAVPSIRAQRRAAGRKRPRATRSAVRPFLAGSRSARRPRARFETDRRPRGSVPRWQRGEPSRVPRTRPTCGRARG